MATFIKIAESDLLEITPFLIPNVKIESWDYV